MKVEEHYTPKDVAGILEVSYVTVMNYIKRKQLPAFKRGGRWMIKKDDLEIFIKEGNVDE